MNKRMIAGIILLLPVLAAAVFGPMLAPYAKAYSEPVRFEEAENSRKIIAPPSAPSSEHKLGTNKRGKDILSLILYGARWTVGTTVILAALKVLAGGILGLSAVFRRKQHRSDFHAAPLNALPQIVFLYFMLAKISINFPFNEMILITIFGVIVLIFGTPASASSIEAAARELTDKEFYTAAKISGASRLYLTTHHILPFLKERLLSLFINEMISVLNTIGQMGIFNVFLGATVLTWGPPIFSSRLNEWAGLVGQARYYIYNEQWILAGPLAAYVLFLLSLYFLLEGLKRHYRKTYRLQN